MRVDAVAVDAAHRAAMSDHETALAEVLKALCDSVRLCLNPRLRSPGAVISVGEARRLQSLFELSSCFQALLNEFTRQTAERKRNS